MIQDHMIQEDFRRTGWLGSDQNGRGAAPRRLSPEVQVEGDSGQAQASGGRVERGRSHRTR